MKMAKNREKSQIVARSDEPFDIPRSHEPFDPDKVLFFDANGKPVTNDDMFRRFGCDIPHANPDTPDEVAPDIIVEREFYEDDVLRLADGRRIKMFGFTIPGKRPQFPSATMRFKEGQIVHSIVKMKKNTHTIHHHGIEPTNFNDGVGHTSFEISGSYKYQFIASHAGTYFYHCHKNTVLHFEMGMYGLLIVDPPVAGAPFDSGGAGFIRRADDIVPYDVEALWVVDEIDSRWHEVINHQAGIQCPFYNVKEDGQPTGAEDPGLNNFKPDIFLISGVPAEGLPIDDPRIAVQATTGQTILVRLLNAGYTVQEYKLRGLEAEVVEVDGRTLGQPSKMAFSSPFTIQSGDSFRLSTAQRWAMLIKAHAPGEYPFEIKFHHWISGEKLAEISTIIKIV